MRAALNPCCRVARFSFRGLGFRLELTGPAESLRETPLVLLWLSCDLRRLDELPELRILLQRLVFLHL